MLMNSEVFCDFLNSNWPMFGLGPSFLIILNGLTDPFRFLLNAFAAHSRLVLNSLCLV